MATHGSSSAGAEDARWPEPSPSIPARAIIGQATAIGARKPVPTHIGNNVGPAGARSPQPWVNVRASSTATASMQKVRMYCEHARSEEHTSELQSLRHLVCRLLLEKKKKTKNH